MDPISQAETGKGTVGLSGFFIEEASKSASALDQYIKTISQGLIVPESIRQAAAGVHAIGETSKQLRMAFGARTSFVLFPVTF